MSPNENPSIQAVSGARRREATQRDILGATKRLLMRGEPVAALSIDRIVAEAKVSRATFYLHFADKHDVIARLADEIVAQRDVIGAEALADPAIGREALDRVLEEMVARWVRDAPLLSAIIELAEYDPRMHETWVESIHEVGVKGAEVMRARWAGSPSAAPDPETMGQILSWMFERSAHQLTRDPARRAEVTAALSEICWRVLDYRPGD